MPAAEQLKTFILAIKINYNAPSLSSGRKLKKDKTT